MTMPVYQFELSGKRTLDIMHDEDPESPREWTNLGKMICFHRRYDLGDKTDYRSDDYSGWDDLRAALEADDDVLCILPLYLMDHSGLAMNTGGFGCPWDSGQVGFIIATKATVAECGTPPELIEECLRCEVKTYSQYISGDCYGYVIADAEGEHIDSCWGFFGTDAAIEAGKEAA
jgi:hypothetical protein